MVVIKRTYSQFRSSVSTVYTRGFVMDGNFTAVHQKQKRPEDDVWLVDGEGFMVGRHPYVEHLKTAKVYKEVSHNWLGLGWWTDGLILNA
jgi:hypothetical protein